jgi:hypothetical protein
VRVSPLTFCCWRWLSPVGYRSTFAPETVYALREMIKRHYPHPHRFVCVTDQPERLPGIETIRLWDDCAAIPSPFGRHNPSCYRRLKLFARDAGKMFGERVVSMDLDTVIVGDLTPLFDRPETFVGWGCSDFQTQWLNGSIYMLRTGSHPEVWETFDPDTSPEKAKRAKCFGSDQGWMRYVLGKDVATWGVKDGLYSYRKHICPAGNVLPANAKIVAFHGKVDPWHYSAQNVPWIKSHYPRGIAA